MAPHHALVALLSFVAAATAQSSTNSGSAFWTYTSRLAAIVTPSPYTRANGQLTTYTMTATRTIKPTVTPTATPTLTSTYLGSRSDLLIVYQYYGKDAVAESDLVPERDYLASTTSSTISTLIYFSMPVTMTAPASCPTQFTVTTTASVSVPSQVWDQMKPSSTVERPVTTRTYGYEYRYQTWYLTPGAAPFTTTSDLYYSLYIASCSTPPGSRATTTGTSGSGSGYTGDSNGSSSYRCYRYSYYCGTPLRTWIIIIATVIPGLFVLGLLESYFWFRRLMMGKSAMRFGTVCWVLISLWVLCFTRMQDARSKEDQVVLQEKWKNMGSGAALKAWLKWGFRHKYPVEHLGQYTKLTVGIVPEGQPIHPAMAQAPPGAPGQVFYYGPPPPGWVPTPDGQGYMPPAGYPAPQQGGYYGNDVPKDRSMVSSSPVSALGPQHPQQHPQGYPVSPVGTSPPPQAPQPVYQAPGNTQAPAPSPPPQGAPPPAPAPQQPAAPPANVSEAPANTPQRPANAPQPPPPKNDPNDRSLYE